MSDTARHEGGVGATRARLDVPEVRAVLDANRAKLDMLRAARLGNPSDSPGADLTTSPIYSSVGGSHSAQGLGREDAEGYSNPVYDQAKASSPYLKSSPDYLPKYSDAIRSAPMHFPGVDSGLPECGDLWATGSLAEGRDTDSPSYELAPSWDKSRRYLSGSYLQELASETDAQEPLALEAYPPGVQEKLLVEDLLSAFVGAPGSLIRARTVASGGSGHARLRFELVARGQVELSLQEMAARMLPLCEYAAVVRRWVETRRSSRWGATCQALAGALRALAQDWHLMVAQLEGQAASGRLTLQALWYYVQPPSEALRCAACLCADAAAGKLRGAVVLDLLARRCARASGDAQAEALLCRLLTAASEPCFAALRRWVGEGVLEDPSGEFLVEEAAGAPPLHGRGRGEALAALWDRRWRLRQRPDGVAAGPVFLRDLARSVLDAGKYLNLLRYLSGGSPDPTLALDAQAAAALRFDAGGHFRRALLARCQAVSSRALGQLRTKGGLLPGLKALKRCFLTAQGDLFTHFLDAVGADFDRPASGVSLAQLQAALDLAVRSSSAAGDARVTRMRAAFDTRSLLNMLITVTQTSAAPFGGGSPPGSARGLRAVTPAPLSAAERSAAGRQKTARESFMLAYEAPWPLSLVAPDAALAHYQMMFRHLLELKWVERELGRVWQLYQRTAAAANRQGRAAARAAGGGRRPAPSPLAAALGQGMAVCQLASHFFRQCLLYIMFEVVEPLWRNMEAGAENADSLDQIIAEHEAFLRRLMKGCLLSRKVVVLRALLALKDLALQFVKLSDRFLSRRIEVLVEEDSDLSAAGSSKTPEWERRIQRADRTRAAIEASLMGSQYISSIKPLRAKLIEKTVEFMAQLAEAHLGAAAEGGETREDLESLTNLVARLDYNHYFAKLRSQSARDA